MIRSLLQSQEAHATLLIDSLDRTYTMPVPINLDIVTTISNEDERVHRPNHFTCPEDLRLGMQTEGDTITLPDEKATRLLDAFRQLRPGHDLQCHDFVARVEGWDEEMGLGSKQAYPTQPTSSLATLMRSTLTHLGIKNMGGFAPTPASALIREGYWG
jgi:hypothetical protein